MLLSECTGGNVLQRWYGDWNVLEWVLKWECVLEWTCRWERAIEWTYWLKRGMKLSGFYLRPAVSAPGWNGTLDWMWLTVMRCFQSQQMLPLRTTGCLWLFLFISTAFKIDQPLYLHKATIPLVWSAFQMNIILVNSHCLQLFDLGVWVCFFLLPCYSVYRK